MSTHITTKNKTRNGNIELFEIELTKAQIRAFSNLLPKGFSLQLVPKKKQDLAPQPTKKLFTNDGNQVVKKPAKSAVIPHEDILINKHALRDPTKRKLSTHFEYKYPDFEAIPTTSSKSSRPNNDALRKCYSLLQKLKKHHSAGPFLLPVDVEGLGLTDYYDIVHEPMDLCTAENKLKNGQYLSANQFATDVRKIWNNAFLYNMNGSPIYAMTIEMSSYFEKLFKEIEHVGFNDPVRDLEKKVEMLSKQITELHQRGISSGPEPPKMIRSGSKASKSAKLMEKPLTSQEKKVLGQNIKKLPPEHLRGVWDIVSQRMDLSNNNQEELEFDIENLPVSVARELERFVKHKMSLLNRSKNKNKGKELSVPSIMQPTFNNFKQQETEYEHAINKGEDEVTTQHHSVMGSDGKPESKGDLNAKEDNSPSNSSESSFISDSDSDGEDESKDKNRIKASKSLQTKQELANFLAGSHGSMLNSFIVK